MNFRAIQTAQEHRGALARIEKLMSASANTPEGEELDLLATLVSAYEVQHFPLDADTHSPNPAA